MATSTNITSKRISLPPGTVIDASEAIPLHLRLSTTSTGINQAGSSISPSTSPSRGFFRRLYDSVVNRLNTLWQWLKGCLGFARPKPASNPASVVSTSPSVDPNNNATSANETIETPFIKPIRLSLEERLEKAQALLSAHYQQTLHETFKGEQTVMVTAFRYQRLAPAGEGVESMREASGTKVMENDGGKNKVLAPQVLNERTDSDSLEKTSLEVERLLRYESHSKDERVWMERLEIVSIFVKQQSALYYTYGSLTSHTDFVSPIEHAQPKPVYNQSMVDLTFTCETRFKRQKGIVFPTQKIRELASQLYSVFSTNQPASKIQEIRVKKIEKT